MSQNKTYQQTFGKGNETFQTVPPRLIAKTKKVKAPRLNEKGEIMPGPDEITFRGNKVFCILYERELVTYEMNPEYYEVKEDKTIVYFDFDKNGEKFEIKKPEHQNKPAEYALSLQDARHIQLTEENKKLNEKVDKLTNLLEKLLPETKEEEAAQ